MTLYLKYRPQKIEDLDLENVRDSLVKIVKSGNIPHAFLFSGPKGTGKTSAARILAKIVNCDPPSPKLRKDREPCNECEQCISITRGENLDVIEIDAASHRGIDDIRILRDAVKLAPARAKTKVYIIDEAHMLTPEASNALLKTLEEPPAHVMFILATTNPEKLIETIRSRTTNLVFRKATTKELERSLKKVVKGESVEVEDGALEMIAKFSNGSFRDAVKILEQLLVIGERLDKNSVKEKLLGHTLFDMEEFFKNLVSKDAKSMIEQINSAVDQGMSAKVLSDEICRRFRSALMNKIGLDGEGIESLNEKELVYLIKLFSSASRDAGYSVLEQIPLELAIVEWCDRNLKTNNFKLKIKEKSSGRSESEKAKHTSDGQGEGVSKKVDDRRTLGSRESVNGVSEEVWVNILKQVRVRNTSTEALLRAARPLGLDKGVLSLGVYYKFHKEKLEVNPHRDLLESVLKETMDEKVRVVCSLTESPEVKIEEAGEEVILTEPDSLSAGSGSIVTGSEPSVMADSNPALTDEDEKDIINAAREIFNK